jgi:uncharacterized protein (TIGR03905 family)
MKKMYIPTGTCSRRIDVDIEDGVIRSAEFHGGCPGNLQGISQLVAGMDARKARDLLSGIKCGMKSTSCPDQLARAIDEVLQH